MYPTLLPFTPGKIALFVLLLTSLCVPGWASASEQPRYSDPGPYRPAIFWQQASEVKWETAALFAGATALGLYNWDWGSTNHFKFNSEGWFGPQTGSGGADKLGHAFTSYAMNNLFIDSLVYQGHDVHHSALTSVLLTQALMLYVEIFDGYSADHGFSYEDMLANITGSTFAYLRAVNPRIQQRMDFRMEYQPSGYRGFRPLSDYSGQTYLLALKLGGFEPLRSTPLRYVDLQLGYYTRGFSEAESDAGLKRQRHTFVGLGLNLNELILGARRSNDRRHRRYTRLFLEHIQPPYTSVRQERQF